MANCEYHQGGWHNAAYGSCLRSDWSLPFVIVGDVAQHHRWRLTVSPHTGIRVEMVTAGSQRLVAWPPLGPQVAERLDNRSDRCRLRGMTLF